MKILSLEYEDKARGWKLEKTTFGNLTLLVGASGVGKTQILNAIQNLVYISIGNSFPGVQWRIEFQTLEAESYVWEGEFEEAVDADETQYNNANKFQSISNLLYERLSHEGRVIFQRNNGDIIFNSEQTVKLPRNSSALHLLREEKQIRDVVVQLFAITAYTHLPLSGLQRHTHAERAKINMSDEAFFTSEHDSLAEIRRSITNIWHKLYRCQNRVPVVFEAIRSTFINIFPFVEDVAVHEKIVTTHDDVLYNYEVKVRETGVANWIAHSQISSGMITTLLQISQLHLSPDGTVFLIDEFENSLGVNCINEVTSAILTSTRDLQFILTSHHPYIINNISYEHWKIVTRYGGIVSTHDAEEFNLGKSKHKAFIQLSNLDAYVDGVTS